MDHKIKCSIVIMPIYQTYQTTGVLKAWHCLMLNNTDVIFVRFFKAYHLGDIFDHIIHVFHHGPGVGFNEEWRNVGYLSETVQCQL